VKIYFDTCSLQRPLDSKTQIRIVLEAEAVLGILSLCETGEVDLVSSDILLFETGRNPHMTRQRYALEVLSKAHEFVALSTWIEERARVLDAAGIKPLDALHLASAESAQADYLCTCDDQFLRRVKEIEDIQVRVASPIELIEEIER
jgi:predicted nucleic acid-binding protein